MDINNMSSDSAGGAAEIKPQLPGQAELEKIFGGPISLAPARVANSPRLFHGKFADYLWCGRCKRTFANGIYRQVGDFRRCPYADCEGHASVDAMPWERIKTACPDYPDIPVTGTRYPMAPPLVPARAGFF
jgi:hypothetical protein